MTKQLSILFLFQLLFFPNSMAQVWKINLPPSNEYFYYKVAEASGNTSEIAEEKALAKLIYEVHLSKGIDVSMEEINKAAKNGGKLPSKVAVGIPINKVCCEIKPNPYSRGYIAIILCQVAYDARQNNLKFPTFNCITGKENINENNLKYNL